MADTAQAAYTAARKLGRKFVSDNAAREYHGYLPVLDDRLQGVEIMGEISLGLHEIPLKKVVGTRTEGRSNAFAGNFMPLLESDSEFGVKWMNLYASHIQEGIREPIKVYEYINRYYVQEGNKRVSVLKYCGSPSVDAMVTRVIPQRDESNLDISIYYEFLDFDRRAVFDNLWFTRRGGFTYLVRLTETFMKNFPEAGKLGTAELIRQTHKTFRTAYKRVGPHGLNLTTGDALLEYIRLFGYPYGQDLDTIARNIRTATAQFQIAAVQGEQTTVEEKTPEKSGGWSVFTRRPKQVRAVFAFSGRPENNPWTRQHEAGIRRLEYKYREKLQITRIYDVPEEPGTCYRMLNAAMEQKPDVLFTTNPSMSNVSMRVALENPDTAVFNCDRAQERKNLNTYFPKTQDVTYLCGVVAGAMTRKDKLGFMSSKLFRNDSTYDVNAFALGAQVVNPRVKVMNYLLQEPDDYREQNHACLEFTRFGADVAFVMQSFTNPVSRKAFPGIFGQLYVLHPEYGFPDECIGAAACDWFVFYDWIISSIFNGELSPAQSGEGEAIHFGWGLNTGLVDVYGVDAFMGHNAMRLLEIFRGVVASGRVHPFYGPVFDQAGTLRIEEYHTPTLMEIQNMDWYAENVIKISTSTGQAAKTAE